MYVRVLARWTARTRAPQLGAALRAAGIRVEVDNRDTYTSGWKFNYWELKGVPLRLEVGPRDLEAGSATCVRRDNRAKTSAPFAGLGARLQSAACRAGAVARDGADTRSRLCDGTAGYDPARHAHAGACGAGLASQCRHGVEGLHSKSGPGSSAVCSVASPPVVHARRVCAGEHGARAMVRHDRERRLGEGDDGAEGGGCRRGRGRGRCVRARVRASVALRDASMQWRPPRV